MNTRLLVFGLALVFGGAGTGATLSRQPAGRPRKAQGLRDHARLVLRPGLEKRQRRRAPHPARRHADAGRAGRPGRDHAHLVHHRPRGAVLLAPAHAADVLGRRGASQRRVSRSATSSASATAWIKPFISLPIRVTSDGRARNCYWPMPFRKSARITVTNESDKRCRRLLLLRRLAEAPVAAGRTRPISTPCTARNIPA